MNQTYPRLIALGSRKRAKRAALSRTGPIFVESSEAGRSIVIESLAARIHRAYSALLLPSTIPPPPPLPPLPSPPWQANNDDPSPLEADLGGTVSKRDSVFSPTAAGALRFCIFPRTVLYEVGGEGRAKVGPRAKSIRRTVFAVVKRRSDTTLARDHFRCRRPRSSYRF